MSKTSTSLCFDLVIVPQKVRPFVHLFYFGVLGSMKALRRPCFLAASVISAQCTGEHP